MQARKNELAMHDKKQRKIVSSVVSQLRALRKEKNLSHEKVAQASKLNRSTISLIESGKIQPTMLTLLKICEALDCNLGGMVAKAEKEAG
jgi:transcriptional regulator with XRE-family HTH domain